MRAPTKKQNPISDIIITDLSYTKIRDVKTCPALAKFKYIDKLPEPENDAIKRGNAVHKYFEDFLLGKTKKLPKEFSFYQDYCSDLKKAYAVPEAKWAFFRNSWEVAPWSKVPGVWRLKVDVHAVDHDTLFITDWKTGKKRNTPPEEAKFQNELYALGGMLTYPNIKKVITTLAYVDEQDSFEDEFSRTQLEALKKKWNKEDAAIKKRTDWPAKQNSKCRFCAFRRDLNGPCKY